MRKIQITPFTRRRLLQGSAAIAASTAVTSFLPKFKVYASTSNQPAPPAYATQNGRSIQNYSLSVAAKKNGIVWPNMVGLTIGKSTMKKGYFGSGGVANATTVQFFKTLCPNGGTLKLGQGTEDELTWNQNGTGEISNELTPTDTANLAAFLIALGNWKVVYGINLGGMAVLAAPNDPGGTYGVLEGTEFPTSTTDAAQEVQSLIEALGGATAWGQYITGIEMGNEPDLDAWHAGHSFCIDSNAKVVITDPTGQGSGATATATVVSGQVTAVSRNNKGSGYSSSTYVTITGSGSGAQVTPIISGGQIGSYTVSNEGSGYNTPACDNTVGTWSENSGSVPWNFEATWQSLHDSITSMMSANGYGTMPFVGPEATNVFSTGGNGYNVVNDPDSWINEFGTDKGSQLAMLTFHYYPYTSTATAFTLLQQGGIDPVLIGPNPDSGNPTEPTNGILSNLYAASATVPPGHVYGISEANSIAGAGLHGVSDSYASALWVIDFILAIAQGYSDGAPSGNGGRLASFNGGGLFGCDAGGTCNAATGNFYSPIYDNGAGTIQGILPIFYGMMFIAHHLGTGELYQTTLSPSNVAITTYAMEKSNGISMVILNKDNSAQWLNLTLTVPGTFSSATLLQLTQGNVYSAEPNIEAYPAFSGDESYNVCIQGITGAETVNGTTGAYTASTPYTLNTPSNNSGNSTVSFYVPPFTAVLVKLS